QGFAGAEELQFIAKRFLGAIARKFRGQEFAGGEIHEGEADGGGCEVVRSGSEEVVFAGVEDGNVGGGAGSDDAETSRRTSFLPGPGCSICSQMATLKPARMRRAR